MKSVLFFCCSGDHRDLHSFPTRRSSDLGPRPDRLLVERDRAERLPVRTSRRAVRSEEHTSELQSPDHLVCRLLLEKKKATQSALPPTQRQCAPIAPTFGRTNATRRPPPS